MDNYRKKLGQWGENIAKEYLIKKGYKILDTHFQKREGEIDIIAKENDELVFVEVKTRTSLSFGWPEESINWSKQERLSNAIDCYLAEHPTFSGHYRLDCIVINIKNKKAVIKHLKNLELA